jgi:hypothetical protein
MMPKLQRLDTSGIITWFSIYNRIKDCASKADDEAISLLNNDSVNSKSVCSTSLDIILAKRQGFTLRWKSWTTSLTG